MKRLKTNKVHHFHSFVYVLIKAQCVSPFTTFTTYPPLRLLQSMLLLPIFHTRSVSSRFYGVGVATEVNQQADQVHSVHVSEASQEP